MRGVVQEVDGDGDALIQFEGIADPKCVLQQEFGALEIQEDDDDSAEESPTKIAKAGEEAYYRVIDGIKYDNKLLGTIEELARDGQVSYVDAKQIWVEAQDGHDVTECERATIEYAMTTYKFTDKAAKAMKIYLEGGKHKSYYKVIEGVKYDRELFEMAKEFEADGQISVKEAKTLFWSAYDGKGITGTERNTLEHIAKTVKFTDKARTYFEEVIKLPEPTSYYKVIDGNKYDAGLLLEIEDAASDGTISSAEAERIWKSSQDGLGVTDIEKATMKYALASHRAKFTDPAFQFLDEKLSTFSWQASAQQEPSMKNEEPNEEGEAKQEDIVPANGLEEEAGAAAMDINQANRDESIEEMKSTDIMECSTNEECSRIEMLDKEGESIATGCSEELPAMEDQMNKPTAMY
jgi:hypothetical protein